MSVLHRYWAVFGHTIVLFSVILGVLGGVASGIAVPAAPWVGGIVASLLVVAFGGLGFTLAGDIFAATCPCCSSHTVATTWRQTFQCQHCHAVCVLAALRQQQVAPRQRTSPSPHLNRCLEERSALWQRCVRPRGSRQPLSQRP
ncbi:MAG: hypothetical protein M1296_06500 [Chloroflexi bacterium]|nr:hypothetical protein [Chloroflexota bacterium]